MLIGRAATIIMMSPEDIKTIINPSEPMSISPARLPFSTKAFSKRRIPQTKQSPDRRRPHSEATRGRSPRNIAICPSDSWRTIAVDTNRHACGKVQFRCHPNKFFAPLPIIHQLFATSGCSMPKNSVRLPFLRTTWPESRPTQTAVSTPQWRRFRAR